MSVCPIRPFPKVVLRVRKKTDIADEQRAGQRGNHQFFQHIVRLNEQLLGFEPVRFTDVLLHTEHLQ